MNPIASVLYPYSRPSRFTIVLTAPMRLRERIDLIQQGKHRLLVGNRHVAAENGRRTHRGDACSERILRGGPRLVLDIQSAGGRARPAETPETVSA